MPSPPTLDIEALLAPIAGDNPSGESLRYAGTYDAIQEARRSDDAFDRGEWVREIKTADWPRVIETATEALTTRSKDLQIAVWLTEALIKRHSFAGLRDGLQLLWALQERFWETLYPVMEEAEDIEFRAAPLEWLNDKLPLAIVQLPLTQSPSGEAYSWAHWQESRRVDNLGRRDQEAMQTAIAEGKITGEQFDKAAEATPVAYYQTLFEDLNLTQQAYQKLDQFVDDKFGREAPSLLGLKQVIEDCRTLVEDMLRKRGGLQPEPTAPVSDDNGEETDQVSRSQEEPVPMAPASQSTRPVSPATPASFSLEPQDRADALRRLAAVADYFRRTEPHSPVAYLVQRAVRWGEMPLEDWLRYVIHDETVLDSVRETLGLNDTADRGADAYSETYSDAYVDKSQE